LPYRHFNGAVFWLCVLLDCGALPPLFHRQALFKKAAAKRRSPKGHTTDFSVLVDMPFTGGIIKKVSVASIVRRLGEADL
jgi:hypothetical protein